jgi:hypothetical protein
VAIKIPFVADVASFLRGTSDMEAALEDVSGALDDLARTDATQVEDDLQGIGKAADQASQDVEQLGQDLDDAGKGTGLQRAEGDLKDLGAQADTTGEKIERSFSEAFDKVKAEGRTATQRVKHDLKDTGDAGSATMSEFSQEAKQNVSETLSSFDGSASSAVDAIQGTFGGLVSALGPAGLVGAAVVAAGVGLARGLFEKSKEAAQEVAEGVADLAGQLIELGSLSLGTEQVNDQLKEFASTAEDGKVKLDELRLAAEKAGISATTYARGVAGDNDALQASWDEVTGRLDELSRSEQDLMNTRGASEQQIIDLVSSHRDEKEALGKTRDELLKTDKTLDQSAETAKFYGDAVKAGADATEESAEALAGENEQLRLNSGYKSDALTSELDLLDALDNVKKSRDENGKSLSKLTDKGRDNLRAIDEARRGIIEYGDAMATQTGDTAKATAAMDKQEDVLVHKVAKAFGITEKQARDYIKTLGGIPPAKNTKVTVDDKGTAKKTSDEIDAAAKDRTAAVSLRPDLNDFDRSVKNYLNGKAYYVRLQPRPGKAAHD